MHSVNVIQFWLLVMAIILFFCLVLVHISSATQQIITVSNESQLLQWLCHPPQLLDNHWLQLTEPSYNLSQESHTFCQIENITNLTIQGASEGSWLKGIIMSSEPAFGFGFTNITNLNVLNLNLHICGAAITNKAIRIFNESRPHIEVGQRAIFVFNHCTNVAVKNVNIAAYNGYGMMLLNAMGVVLEEIYLSQVGSLEGNCEVMKSSGSGIMIAYKDSPIINNTQSSKILIQTATLFGNINGIPNIHSLSNTSTEDVCKLPLVGAAGISSIFAQSYLVNMTMVDVTVGGYNYGSVAAAMLMLFLNGMQNSYVAIVNGRYVNNQLLPSITRQDSGSGITLHSFLCKEHVIVPGHEYDSIEFVLEKVEFVANGGGIFIATNAGTLNYGGALLVNIHNIATNINFIIKNGYFKKSYARIAGSAVYAIVNDSVKYKVSFVFNNTEIWQTFKGPADHAIYSSVTAMAFVNINNVTFDGFSYFHDNDAPIIAAHSTSLHLRGNAIFHNSIGKTGAAISLYQLSSLTLHEPLNAMFTDNKALLYGGAIYAKRNDIPGNDRCAIQLHSYRGYPTKYNINVTFARNSAVLAGSSIYATPIYNCLYESSKQWPSIGLFERFNLNYNETATGHGIAEISSAPMKIHSCCSNCSIPPYLSVYPGEDIILNVMALDDNDKMVYSPAIATITSGLYKDRKTLQSDLTLGDFQSLVALKGCTCTRLVYNVLSLNNIYHHAVFNLATPDNSPSWSVHLYIYPCPTGFNLVDGICDCDGFINRIITGAKCNITANSITISSGQWIGHVTISNVSGLGFSGVCPQDNCKTGVSFINLSTPNVLCNLGKVGILCGQCRRELSAVFGSEECMVCSNMWLLTIILYLVIGIAIVFLLLILDITIAQGYLASIIVSANIISVSIIDFLQKDGWFITTMRVFVSLLNLNIGFPLCFYNGMTMTVKTGLQFAFPIYLWLLIIGFIQLSRCSMRVANRTAASSIQVLATLIHMSFAKLLITVFDIFSYASIDTSLNSTVTVWYIDGNVVYFGDVGHIVLFCIATVTVSLITIPYIMVVTFGAQCLRWRLVNKFRPFIEAFHGPYKIGKGYWFGVRVASVVYVYIIFAVLRGHSTDMTILLQLVGLTVLTSIQTWIRPFKSTLVTVMDGICLMTTMVQLAVSLAYNIAIVLSMLQVPLMMVFIGIVSSSCWRKWKDRKKTQFQNGRFELSITAEESDKRDDIIDF